MYLCEEPPFILTPYDAPTARSTPPTPYPCPGTGEHGLALLIRPTSRLDFLRAVRSARDTPSLRCLLVASPLRPDGSPILPAADLTAWMKDAAPHLQCALCTYQPHPGPYACGETACCACNRTTLTKDQLSDLTQLLTRTHSLTEALDGAFPSLDARNRRLLQDWAHLEDATTPGHPIRTLTLAARYQISARQVRRILNDAEKSNPTMYSRLKAVREFRFRKTGGYIVT